MTRFSFSEFRPTFLFVGRFVTFYLVANVLYGVWVSSFEPAPDPATKLVSRNVSSLLNMGGFKTTAHHETDKSTSTIRIGDSNIIAVYEGCNSLGIMIVFAAFVAAFGKVDRKFVLFLVAGFLAIYVANLLRVALLLMIAIYFPDWLYYVHKYLFTAVIYGFVFFLWFIWIRINAPAPTAES